LEHSKKPLYNSSETNTRFKNALKKMLERDSDESLFDNLLITAEVAIPYRERFKEKFNAWVLRRFNELMKKLKDEKHIEALLLFNQNSATFNNAVRFSNEALKKLECDVARAEAEIERKKQSAEGDAEPIKKKRSKKQEQALSQVYQRKSQNP
jgi:hypothetical protein